MSLISEVLTGGIRGGTSINYAALGESVSERGGVINLGTEGSMLCGALAAYAIAAETGNVWIGALAGAVAGGLLASVQAYFVLSRGTNQLATGLVVLFLGLGLTSMFGVDYVQAIAPTFRPIAIPLGPVLIVRSVTITTRAILIDGPAAVTTGARTVRLIGISSRTLAVGAIAVGAWTRAVGRIRVIAGPVGPRPIRPRAVRPRPVIPRGLVAAIAGSAVRAP